MEHTAKMEKVAKRANCLFPFIALLLLACQECPVDPSLKTQAQWEQTVGCKVRSTFSVATAERVYCSLTLYRDTTFEVSTYEMSQYQKGDVYDACLTWEFKPLILHKISPKEG